MSRIIRFYVPYVSYAVVWVKAPVCTLPSVMHLDGEVRSGSESAGRQSDAETTRIPPEKVAHYYTGTRAPIDHTYPKKKINEFCLLCATPVRRTRDRFCRPASKKKSIFITFVMISHQVRKKTEQTTAAVVLIRLD